MDQHHLSKNIAWILQNHHPYRDLLSFTKACNPDSPAHSPSLKSSQRTDHVQDPPETEKNGNGSCLDLLADQFTTDTEKSWNDGYLNLSLHYLPLLPCTKTSRSSKIHELNQEGIKSCQAKDGATPLDSIQFGIFKCSPSSLGLPSSMAWKEAESGASTTLEMQKQRRIIGQW